MSYAELWDAQYEKSRLQKEKFSTNDIAYWNNPENVALFVKRLTADDRGRVPHQLTSLDIPTECSVLDIGSGPGTLAVPLAAKGCKVTALEPSSAMLEVMEKYRTAKGAPEIQTIHASFEDAVLPEKYDYVIASYSLMMGNIRKVVHKIDDAALKEAHIFWFLTPPSKSRGNIDLWPKLHGEVYCYEPTADILWNVLLEEGIYANVHIESRKKSQTYPTREDVYEDFARRMLCKSEEERIIVRNYADRRIIPAENGFAVPSSTVAAHIWWEK